MLKRSFNRSFVLGTMLASMTSITLIACDSPRMPAPDVGPPTRVVGLASTPIDPGPAATASSSRIAIALSQAPEATLIKMTDAWDGLSQVGPHQATYTLLRNNGDFTGQAKFSVGYN